jgi:hypothetical protein
VLPRGVSRSTDAITVARSSARVGGSTSSTWSSNPTTEIVSSGRRLSVSRASESLTSPSRLPIAIEPDRSTTRVRFTDGRASRGTSRAVTATRTTCWVIGPSGASEARTPDSARTASAASVGAGSP